MDLDASIYAARLIHACKPYYTSVTGYGDECLRGGGGVSTTQMWRCEDDCVVFTVSRRVDASQLGLLVNSHMTVV